MTKALFRNICQPYGMWVALHLICAGQCSTHIRGFQDPEIWELCPRASHVTVRTCLPGLLDPWGLELERTLFRSKVRCDVWLGVCRAICLLFQAAAISMSYRFEPAAASATFIYSTVGSRVVFANQKCDAYWGMPHAMYRQRVLVWFFCRPFGRKSILSLFLLVGYASSFTMYGMLRLIPLNSSIVFWGFWIRWYAIELHLTRLSTI